MIVVTFHSNDTYERYARTMEQSAKKFGLVVMSERWTAPAEEMKKHRAKVGFLRDIRKRYKKEDTLWVDADAMFRGEPTALREIPAGPVVAAVHEGGSTILGGTMWIRGGKIGEAFCEEWEAEQQSRPDAIEMDCLAALRARLGKAVFFPLRHTYCWVESWHRRRFPRAVPVIEHYAIGWKGGKK